MKNWTLSSLSLCALLSLPGCLIIDDDDPPPLLGTLTVEWTIGNRTDPLDCIDFGVDRLELLISGPDGDIEVEAVCEDFITSVDLYEGRYVADATLVDSFDRAATLTEPVDAIDIIADTELVVDIDFPLGSFL